MIKVNVVENTLRRGITKFLLKTETAANRATVRTLNRTVTTVRAEAARLIQEKRNLPIAEIKKSMSVRRATVLVPYAVLTVRGKAISMRHFANAGKRGVTVRIEKGAKRTRLTRYGNNAFINAPWRPGVFVRKGKSRLPIVAWPPVPGLPTVLVQEGIKTALLAVAARSFKARINAELNYELNVKGKRGGAA